MNNMITLRSQEATSNKRILIVMFLLVGILLSLSLSSAYSRSLPSYTASGAYTSGTSGNLVYDEQVCRETGEDFIMQIAPLGCTPKVVRSDLLEDQDVSVFCKLIATKLNPLVEVNAIKQISFSEKERPSSVKYIGNTVIPPKAALGTPGKLNNPVLNEMGYVQIVLGQTAESELENCESDPIGGDVCWAEGNLTARIEYDVKEAWGVGDANYYLPQLSDVEFNNKYKQYGFWNGRAFLKADSIDADGASISIYSGISRQTSSGLGELDYARDKIATVRIKTGETTPNKIYMPGIGFCMAGFNLRLNNVNVPETTAKFTINSEIVEVIEKEKFLENKCWIPNGGIDKNGIVEKVTIICMDDEEKIKQDLSIIPNITLSIDGVEKNVSVGDYLFDYGDKGKVFLGFIGSKNNLRTEESLYMRFVYDPLAINSELTSKEIKEISDFDGHFTSTDLGIGLLDKLGDLGNYFVSKTLEFSKKIVKGWQMDSIEFATGNKQIFGKNVEIIGFSNSANLGLPEDEQLRNYYENALKDYDTIIESYPTEEYPKDQNLGEKAYYNKIDLLIKLDQKREAVNLCDEFKERYPGSALSLEICDDDMKFASLTQTGLDVVINGEVKRISFEGISEPTLEEYGAKIVVKNDKGVDVFYLVHDQIVYLDEAETEYIKLEDLDDDKATIRLITKPREGYIEGTKAALKSNRVNLELNTPRNFDTDYLFTLEKINLERVASVSVLPEIGRQESKSSFSFKVGIEKRAIDLAPEKIEKKISNSDKRVEAFTKINDGLGKTVQAWNGVCLAAEGYFTAKTFLETAKGKGIARQFVMRGPNGWYKRCADELNKENSDFSSTEECLLKKADDIKKEVDSFTEDLNNVNDYLKNLQDNNPDEAKGKSLGLEVINTNNVMKIFSKDFKNNLTRSKFIGDNQIFINPNDDKESINLANDVIPNLDWNGESPKYNTGDLRDAAVYLEIIEDGTSSTDLKKMAEEKLYPIFNQIKENSRVDEEKQNPFSLSFEFFNEASYDNRIVSGGEVRYYEIDPYKGDPAIVPFDLNKGWYAAMKPGLPVFGNIPSLDASGRVKTFYLCNVGKNGILEFYSSIRDDKCQVINTDISQTYRSFNGLQEDETLKLVNNAIIAINDAQEAHRAGVTVVPILGNSIEVGEPAVGMPDMQCQDFMSPKDCSILFNICDPVVCPSSRCDFGGTYPVKDVVQSGIFGSIALCLPNYREGIAVPVCLSGVHAGVEGWLSVEEAYQDCLQNKLETGETIGICDEVYSVYGCDFLWRQTVPMAKAAVPKLVSLLSGQNARGGVEYMFIKKAFKSAGDSVDFFKQYYAKNSASSFNVDSVEESGGSAVCKSYLSIAYPSGGKLLGSLTKPDSPSQFHGRFDEIPFTSTTNPPVSHYKVFYYIYSGEDTPAYFKVHLRAGSGGSFYQDTSAMRYVDGGYIPQGEYKTETIDFTAPAGYKELCINVNGQEECGFKETSTSFAVDYMRDLYLQGEVENMQVSSEKECISGSVNALGLINPNLQAGAEEAIDPAIYNRGIIRICATSNPGVGTDINAGRENSRWAEVGYCGDPTMKCWLDTNSVDEILNSPDIAKFLKDEELGTLGESSLQDVEENYYNLLKEEGEFIQTEEEYKKQIENLPGGATTDKIRLINDLMGKVFYNYQKANLHLLRGAVYGDLARGIYNKLRPKGKSEETSDFVSPVFEFQDGTNEDNLFYNYINGIWRVSNKEIIWTDVSLNPKVMGKVQVGNIQGERQYENKEVSITEKDSSTIKLLVGKSYEEGLKILMERVVANNEAKFILNPQTPALTTDYAEMNFEKKFKILEQIGFFAPGGVYGSAGIQFSSYETLYFEYENEWKWAVNSNPPLEVSKVVVEKGPQIGQTIPEQYRILLGFLEDSSFYEGAALIFSEKENIVDVVADLEIGEDEEEILGQDEEIEIIPEDTFETPEILEKDKKTKINLIYREAYNLHESLFTNYAKKNTPTKWSESEFNALLVSVAQKESGVGTALTGPTRSTPGEQWMMGYNWGGNWEKGIQEGVNNPGEQIKRASSTFKNALNGNSNAYEGCDTWWNNRLKSRKLECVLSVYFSGKTLDLIGKHEGEEYAEEVMGYWGQWKKYFKDYPEKSTSTRIETEIVVSDLINNEIIAVVDDGLSPGEQLLYLPFADISILSQQDAVVLSEETRVELGEIIGSIDQNQQELEAYVIQENLSPGILEILETPGIHLNEISEALQTPDKDLTVEAEEIIQEFEEEFSPDAVVLSEETRVELGEIIGSIDQNQQELEAYVIQENLSPGILEILETPGIHLNEISEALQTPDKDLTVEAEEIIQEFEGILFPLKISKSIEQPSIVFEGLKIPIMQMGVDIGTELQITFTKAKIERQKRLEDQDQAAIKELDSTAYVCESEIEDFNEDYEFTEPEEICKFEYVIDAPPEFEEPEIEVVEIDLKDPNEVIVAPKKVIEFEVPEEVEEVEEVIEIVGCWDSNQPNEIKQAQNLQENNFGCKYNGEYEYCCLNNEYYKRDIVSGGSVNDGSSMASLNMGDNKFYILSEKRNSFGPDGNQPKIIFNKIETDIFGNLQLFWYGKYTDSDNKETIFIYSTIQNEIIDRFGLHPRYNEEMNWHYFKGVVFRIIEENGQYSFMKVPAPERPGIEIASETDDGNDGIVHDIIETKILEFPLLDQPAKRIYVTPKTKEEKVPLDGKVIVPDKVEVLEFTDEEGQPIPDLIVEVDGQEKITDEKGEIEIEEVGVTCDSYNKKDYSDGREYGCYTESNCRGFSVKTDASDCNSIDQVCCRPTCGTSNPGAECVNTDYYACESTPNRNYCSGDNSVVCCEKGESKSFDNEVQNRLTAMINGDRKYIEGDILCSGDNCAKFVTRATEYAFGYGRHFMTGVGGNAWNMPKYVEEHGGQVQWFDWKNGEIFTDYDSLNPGDVIGLYYSQSAYLPSKRGKELGNTKSIDFTHVAIYLGEKGGEHYITHLYHVPQSLVVSSDPQKNEAVRVESIESLFNLYGRYFKVRAVMKPHPARLNDPVPEYTDSIRYVVKKSDITTKMDTLVRIANNHKGKIDDMEEMAWIIAHHNTLVDSTDLGVGDVLKIPIVDGTSNYADPIYFAISKTLEKRGIDEEWAGPIYKYASHKTPEYIGLLMTIMKRESNFNEEFSTSLGDINVGVWFKEMIAQVSGTLGRDSSSLGCMQLQIKRALEINEENNWNVARGDITTALLTKDGCVMWGVEYLDRVIEIYAGDPPEFTQENLRYIFVDYNSGYYTSRNTAFQQKLNDLSGRKLDLDGDLLLYESGTNNPLNSVSNSEATTRNVVKGLGLSSLEIRNQLKKEKSEEFENTLVYKEVDRLWAQKNPGKKVQYGALPDIVKYKIVSTVKDYVRDLEIYYNSFCPPIAQETNSVCSVNFA